MLGWTPSKAAWHLPVSKEVKVFQDKPNGLSKRTTTPKGIIMAKAAAPATPEVATTVNVRPVAIVNTTVLMFIRLTSVFNKVDDLGDKVRQTIFVNDLPSAKAASRDLTNAQGLGYVWMTQRYDHLNEDGSILRTEVNYQWTRKSQWLRKDDVVTTIAAPAKDEAPKADGNAPF